MTRNFFVLFFAFIFLFIVIVYMAAQYYKYLSLTLFLIIFINLEKLNAYCLLSCKIKVSYHTEKKGK